MSRRSTAIQRPKYGQCDLPLLHAGLVAGGPRHGQGGGPPRRAPRAEPRRPGGSRSRRAVELPTHLLVVIGGAGPPRSGLDPQLAGAGGGDPVRRVDPHRHRGFRDALHTRMAPGDGNRPADTTGHFSATTPTDEIDFYTTGGTRYHFLPVTTLSGEPLGRVVPRLCRGPQRQPDQPRL